MKFMSHRDAVSTMSFGCLVMIGLALPFSNTSADAPLQGTRPAQWRVVWNADPSTSATIAWSTRERGKKHHLTYRIKGGEEEPSTQLANTGRYTGGDLGLFYHHAHLTELQPSTAYEIQMISDSEQSPVFYFVTAPSTDREFSLLHGGDSRSDRDARRRINQRIAHTVVQSYDNLEPSDDILALAHGGDYVVTGTKMKLWSAWLSDHELTTAPDGRLLPIIPARGNHDKGKPFNQVFGFPEDDLNYYGIHIGPEVCLLTLNSEISTAGDQATWLSKELSHARTACRWVVTQYHRPVYPAVKTPSSGLLSWVPLFEKHDVDLVCEADGHTIKRTVPIRDGKVDETGIVYIGEGGLGVPQRTPKKDRWFLQSPGMADQGNHFFVLTFGKQVLRGKCVLEDGQVLDEFTRNARDGF